MNKVKAAFFDSQVDEAWASSEFGPAEMRTIERMLRQSRLREGMSVIEPGCGSGRLTLLLAERVGSSGHVLALDISSKMIEACRRRVAHLQNAEVHHGAVEDLAVEDGTFDLVVCHNVFPHFDHKGIAVAHLASALKRAGRFIVFHFMNSAGVNDLHRKADPCVLNDLLPSESEMRQILLAAGLEVESLADDDSGYLLVATRI